MKGLTNTFIDPYTLYWSNHLVNFIKKYNINVVHVHDLYLLGAALRANKRLSTRLPIVGDLHENYPEALKHYKFAQTFPGKYIISIPKWERTEIKWLNKTDHIITVIEEAKMRYQKLGVEEDKITVVANYVNSEMFLAPAFNEDISKKFSKNFVVIYIGGFDLHRGLESAVRSLPLLEKEIPNIKLVLVGAGRNEVDLKQLAHSLKVDHLISFEGWQPPSSIPSYIKISNICLIPHLKTAHTDNTIPHKLFHYMLLEKAVLSSNCNPIQRILIGSKAGLIYDSNNEIELASKLIYLRNNLEKAQKMGKNGKRAVIEKYNWEETKKDLIDLYNKIEIK